MPAQTNIAESPWFWLALFGGMGLLGVVVIGPKFGARMARVERMAETRERVAIERIQRAEAERSGEQPVAPPKPEPYAESDFRPPASLNYLLGLMAIAMLVGTGGVLVTRARERREAQAAVSSTAISSTAESNTAERSQTDSSSNPAS